MRIDPELDKKIEEMRGDLLLRYSFEKEELYRLDSALMSFKLATQMEYQVQVEGFSVMGKDGPKPHPLLGQRKACLLLYLDFLKSLKIKSE